MEDAPIATDELIVSIAAQLDSTVGEGGSEVVAQEDGRLYVTNGAVGAIDVFDIATETKVASFDLTALPDYDSLQSVAVQNGVVAAAIARPNVATGAGTFSQPGYVAFYDADTGALLSTVDVGNLPDSIHFTDDGTQLVVAGEGEFNEDSETADNPLGTIAVIDTTDPSNPTADILDFTAFNGDRDALLASRMRLAPDFSVAQDIEPEYVAISPDGETAYVTVQENNGIAVVDLTTNTITDLISTGLQNHSVNGLDPDDDGQIGIDTFDNLVGARMGDAIAAHEIDGATYLFTANEGDGRGDGDAFPGDEARVGDILDGDIPGLSIDPSVDTTGLERLVISTQDGDVDGDGDIDILWSFGARSFTIYDTDGTVVFDSGSEFERIVADLAGERFNNDDGDTIEEFGGDEVDNRSDAKGPEPEAIAVGEVNGQTYAFIGLERDSGIMIYNVTDPANSTFVTYLPPAFQALGDDLARIGPETIEFISAAESTSGNPQIAVANEISGTTIVYDLESDLAVVVGTEGDDILYARASGGRVEGLGGDDILTGSDFGDRLFGGDGNDDLFGGDGADTLFANSGDDYAEGEGGRDLLKGGLGDNVLRGGDGADTIEGSGGNDTIAGDDGRDLIQGGASNDVVRGGAGNDRIYGDGGNDTLVGNEGADTIYGGNGADVLGGDSGNDLIFGGNGKDALIGNTGNDRLYGEAGEDTLSGGNGNDQLFGGTGLNTATGGAGADMFALETGGRMLIADFVQGTDVLGLEAGVEFDDLTLIGNTVEDEDGVILAEFTNGFDATTLTADDVVLLS